MLRVFAIGGMVDITVGAGMVVMEGTVGVVGESGEEGGKWADGG